MTGPWWDGWAEDYPSIQDFLEPIYGSNGGYNISGYLTSSSTTSCRRGTSRA